MGRQDRSKRESGEQFATTLQRDKVRVSHAPRLLIGTTSLLALRSGTQSKKDCYGKVLNIRLVEARGCEEGPCRAALD